MTLVGLELELVEVEERDELDAPEELEDIDEELIEDTEADVLLELDAADEVDETDEAAWLVELPTVLLFVRSPPPHADNVSAISIVTPALHNFVLFISFAPNQSTQYLVYKLTCFSLFLSYPR